MSDSKMYRSKNHRPGVARPIHIMKPYHYLARAILEKGLKDNDRFDYREEWLDDLCTLAGFHPDQYQQIMDYVYGPRRKDE